MNRRDALRRHARTIGGALTFAQALAFSGCSNMSGLDGSSSYSCKAPDGVACDSVSGTYANAIHNNLPSQRPRKTASPPSPSSPASPASPTSPTVAGAASAPAQAMPRMPSMPAVTVPSIGLAGAASSMPPRSSARILRLWFKPWEDADHDLYDQGYVYVQIDSGRWLVEHVHRQIREAHAPLRPPPRAAAASSDAHGGNAPAIKGSLVRPPYVDKLIPGPLAPSNTTDGTE